MRLRSSPLRLAMMLAGALALAPCVHAQRATVRGFVTDASDGQPLPGVNVAVTAGDGEVRGAATDPDGLYLIPALEPGRYAVRASFVGYLPFADTLDLGAGARQLDVALVPTETELGEVAVEGERTSGSANVTAGLQRVTPEDVRMVPSPDVNGDLAGYLTTLPGVVASGDRGGQLFIRGGEPTQNLVLLDGIPVFQPFHVLGFYSAFPADLLQSADLYSGGYPARYGGQLSSVLDVATRYGDKRRFGASLSAAPFVSGATVEGPVVPGRVSLLLSGRKSVIEQGAARLVDAPLPFDFGDAFAKLHYAASSSSQFAVTGLYTHDRGSVGDPEAPRPDEVAWTNAGGGFRYLFLPTAAPLLAEIVLSYSRLDTSLGPGREDGEPADPNDPEDYRLRRTAGVGRFNGSFDLTSFGRYFDVHFGGSVRTTTLGSELGGLFQDFRTEQRTLTEAGFYVEPELRPARWLRVTPGVRLALSSDFGQRVEPRLRVVAEAGPHRLAGAAGLYHQPIVGVSDRRDATSIFTVWTATPFGRTPRALDAVLSYRVAPVGGLELAVEGFYKEFDDLSVGAWTAYPRLTTRLQGADGRARGLDARAEVRAGVLHLALSYGLSAVAYTTAPPRYASWADGPAFAYRPPHDRRHQFNALARVTVLGFDCNARWQFGSGLPYSRALGFDVFIPPVADPDVFGTPGEPRVIYERPFSGRLPAYHRLDVTVERVFDLGPAALTAQAGVINAYDRANVFAYDVFTLRRVDQLPLVPIFGLKLATD